MADDMIQKMLQQHYEEITYLIELGDAERLRDKLSQLTGDPKTGRGLAINAPTPHGKFLLHKAVESGNTEVVKLLIDYTCKAFEVHGRYAQPIVYRTDVNVTDHLNGGIAPLHRAVQIAQKFRNADMFDLLFKSGAYIASRDDNGESALDYCLKFLEQDPENPALKKIRDIGIREEMINPADIHRKIIKQSIKKNPQNRYKL